MTVANETLLSVAGHRQADNVTHHSPVDILRRVKTIKAHTTYELACRT